MIDPAAPAPVGNMGQPIPRYDARAKVTGAALYAADMALPDVAYAYLLSSRIAKGRIKSFDLERRSCFARRARHSYVSNDRRRHPQGQIRD